MYQFCILISSIKFRVLNEPLKLELSELCLLWWKEHMLFWKGQQTQNKQVLRMELCGTPQCNNADKEVRKNQTRDRSENKSTALQS